MDDKKECIKTINILLEKILEEFTDILEFLKVKNISTKQEEMKALVFSKQRMIQLTENMQKIFQNFVYLKLIDRNLSVKYEDEEERGIFEEFYRQNY